MTDITDRFSVHRPSVRLAPSSSRAGWIAAATAAALLGAAWLVRRQSRAAEQRNPPAGRWLEIDRVRLHYLDQGQGDVVVLLHGNGSMTQDFVLSGIFDALARRYRVIAFDRPGFGYSSRPHPRRWSAQAQAELLTRALQRLEIDQPIIVAHSWGTLVALAMAQAHGERLRALVLLSGYYFPSLRVDIPLLSLPAVPLVGTLLRNTLSPLLSRLLWPAMRRQLFAPAEVSDNFRRWPVGLTVRPAQLRAAALDTGWMNTAAARLAPHYAGIGLPVTLMAGSGDRIVDPRQQTQRLHQTLPNSELQMVEGAGHMLHHIAPDQVMAAIDRAMQRSRHIAPPVQHAPSPAAQ